MSAVVVSLAEERARRAPQAVPDKPVREEVPHYLHLLVWVPILVVPTALWAWLLWKALS